MDLKGFFFRHAQLFALLLPAIAFATGGTLSGSGTPIDPFLVADYSDLEVVGTTPTYSLSAVYRLTADINASASAGENSGAGFLPIGNGSTNFTGTFHGAGHTIKYLYINRPTTEYVGLFGYTSGSTIDSVGLINNTISGKTSVGGISGYNSGGISFCYNTGSLNSATTRVGGISGQNYKGAISQCYNTGNISGTDFSVGGISGYNDSGAVSYCYNTGNVAGIPYVGGIAGVNSGTTMYCYNSGHVTGTSDVGAIVGSKGTSSAVGIVSNCYWDSLTSNQTIGYGSNSGTITNVIGLTTAQMRNIANLSNLGSFTSTWTIRPDSTYPGLLALNNAPFAFTDTLISITRTFALSQLLLNDCDIETARNKLILHITSASAGTTDSVNILTLTGVVNKTIDTVKYRVGEIRSADTLWGNQATALITLDTIAIPGAVSLASPTGGATGVSITPILTWNAGAGGSPVMYLVKVSTTSDFSSFVINDSTTNPTYTVSTPLSNNTTYSWEVAAKNAAGVSTYSTSSFTTIVAAPGITTLLTPSNAAANVSINPVLSWNKVIGADSYRLQVATDSLFSASVIYDTTLSDTTKLSGALTNNLKYFWRVESVNASGISPWSSIASFTIIVAVPAALTLKAPSVGDTVKADSVLLSWSTGTPSVDRYWVQYSADSAFTSPTSDSSYTDTTMLVRGLNNNVNFWWHIKAHNAAGWGVWSNKSEFVVKLPSTLIKLSAIPKTFSFNVSGRDGSIHYALPKAENVFLRIFNLKGQMLDELVNTSQNPGYYSITLPRYMLAPGRFIVAFNAGEYRHSSLFLPLK
jgi:hypothetical protein